MRNTFITMSLLTLVLVTLQLQLSVLEGQGPGGSWGSSVGSVSAVLEAAPQPYCCLILLTDGAMSTETAIKEVRALRTPCGEAIFQVSTAANVSWASLAKAIVHARQLRGRSRYVTMLVVSDDLNFLAAFAELSVRGRLLVWDTRLLLLSHLPLWQVQHLLRTHWTYTMMRAVFILPSNTSDVQK
ncbi:uncharacterized protein [Panulirus ornatus]|uniref:uncharacterized protein n=1 Tax=Panulirus ornatus TaxID=150431 RepID=UPI003A8B9CB1